MALSSDTTLIELKVELESLFAWLHKKRCQLSAPNIPAQTIGSASGQRSHKDFICRVTFTTVLGAY